MATPPKDDQPYTEEQVANIIEYLESVRTVVQRLLDDGYTIDNGEIVPPTKNKPML